MKRVLEIFSLLCEIPHGSGNMAAIADFCVSFARGCNLSAEKDAVNNVMIRKPASPGYESAKSVILQGHLDMVCQKEEGLAIDFEKEGIECFVEGDFLKARGTTLGADNGIAVAMALAVLERDDLSHPALEVVLTTDEEIGMIGAGKLDFKSLKSKTMINLDSEEDDTVTVSCAGGSDFVLHFPLSREAQSGTKITLTLKGLQGGHSGVEIGKGRVNADLLLGRVLNRMANEHHFSLCFLDGGDKANAIPCRSQVQLVTADPDGFERGVCGYLEEIKQELSKREPNFGYTVTKEEGEWEVFTKDLGQRIIFALTSAPNGVMEMSADIPGLVETSLNLGILSMDQNELVMHFALRSNLQSALVALEEKLFAFARLFDGKAEAFGHYPPWEYRKHSPLRDCYCALYREKVGTEVKIEALHAGLECGVFAAGIPDLDCIAIGPTLFDVHTTQERMKISSAEKIFDLLVFLLEKMR